MLARPEAQGELLQSVGVESNEFASCLWIGLDVPEISHF
jgi:hypothetical protein